MEMDEKINPYIRRAFDEAFAHFLNEGLSPIEAEEKADLVVLEQSKPMDLPAPTREELARIWAGDWED